MAVVILVFRRRDFYKKSCRDTSELVDVYDAEKVNDAFIFQL